MLFSTPTQFIVLLLMLFIGWLFGFASHPGGRKWKDAYKDESAARARDRDEREAELRDRDGRAAALEKHNAELTAQLERTRVAAPVAAVGGAAVAASAARPAFSSDPTPVPPRKRGWFDWSRGDDLTRLRGVDAELARRLKAEQVDTFSEVAALSDRDEIALERRIDLPAGFIQREQLREQARLLADGRNDEHASRFG